MGQDACFFETGNRCSRIAMLAMPTMPFVRLKPSSNRDFASGKPCSQGESSAESIPISFMEKIENSTIARTQLQTNQHVMCILVRAKISKLQVQICSHLMPNIEVSDHGYFRIFCNLIECQSNQRARKAILIYPSYALSTMHCSVAPGRIPKDAQRFPRCLTFSLFQDSKTRK